MITNNCNTKATPDIVSPADWSLTELHSRAGALVRDALAGQSKHVYQMHREDMMQTAVMSFLEQADKGVAYAYSVAR
ncbi:MAG: hypothetical protein GY934_11120, partial [Gammaproteobacteria bacterium]|nr:hypothetical protein [Gammaproteobacteria bacterium]